jgi:uncharacterized protein (DUF983 family)
MLLLKAFLYACLFIGALCLAGYLITLFLTTAPAWCIIAAILLFMVICTTVAMYSAMKDVER